MNYEQLTSLIGLVFLAIVPYILASQGTMLAGQTGLFNVSQEGVMLATASLGFLGAWRFGSLWAGVLVALLVGGLFGLVFAWFTTTLKLNQFVTRLALFFVGLAGVYLPMVYTGTFTEGIVQGRGWLSSALTFFGGWRPHFIAAGAFFFAVVEVLALRAQVFGARVPHQVLQTLPYLTTIVVMIFGARWTRVPGFLGQNYDREARSVE